MSKICSPTYGNQNSEVPTIRNSAMNARTHGLRSQQVLLPGEDLSEFEGFQEGMKVDLKPVGELESFLFSQIVGYGWRLLRCQRIEGSLLSLGMGHEKVDRAYEKARSCF